MGGLPHNNQRAHVGVRNDVFPLDIAAVARMDVAQWRSSFYWPVPDQEFLAMSAEVMQWFRAHVERAPQPIAEALLVKCGIAFEVWHRFHAQLVVERLRRAAAIPNVSDRTRWYPEIIRGGGGDKSGRCANKPLLCSRTSPPPLMAFVRGWKRNAFVFAESVNVKKIAKGMFGSRPHATVVGVPPAWAQQCLRQRPELLMTTAMDLWTFVDPHRALNAVTRATCASYAATMRDDLRAMTHRFGITEDATLLESIQCDLELQIEDGMAAIAQCSARIASRPMPLLLAPALGSPFQKALAIAVRRHGGTVMGFAHGGNVGVLQLSSYAMSEFAVSDTFMTYTAASATLYERIRDAYPPARANSVRMIAAQSHAYADLRKSLQGMPPRRIRRVMVVGYIHNQWRYAEHPAACSLIRLEFEFRLIASLHRAGVEVLYKPHPEHAQEVTVLLRTHATIVDGDFRDRTDCADAFLFGHFSTTAFPIALCTRKPVLCILLDGEAQRVDQESFALLRRRCTFIPATLDDRQRILYDEEALCDALDCPSSAPDTTFVNRYLCPPVA